MTKISLLGCGWLGLPLAKSLIKKRYLMKGSTTSLGKISSMENEGIHAFQIEVTENKIIGNIEKFLEKSEILIIDIPPKLRANQSESFVKKIENLIPFIENSTIQKVLFISSTSVYDDDNSIITEDTKPQPDTESGKQLLEAEHLLQNNANFKSTVIRFGGLLGEDRHPIHFLSGRTNIENPDAAINLIHQSDCIGIINTIIEKDIWNETFNAVAPFHPSRKDYYTQKAIDLNLSLPQFDTTKKSVGKTISSHKIETVLRYTFQKPTL
jgi:nucleoside-diphosphate-sugar epimerase